LAVVIRDAPTFYGGVVDSGYYLGSDVVQNQAR
jgi:hypothetical protein